MSKENIGKLYIISTPIGNMRDITYRAIDIFSVVGLILAEDTRNTLKLLNHYNIKNKIISFHKFNEDEKKFFVIEKLKTGVDVALVSDAGTPLVSDPGSSLVSLCIKEGIDVVSIPGACAAISSLVVSGFDTREFLFVGFLPEDKNERINKLEKLVKETRLVIVYLSPHKLIKFLKDIILVYGEDRKVALCRELTKIHEEVIRGSLIEIFNEFSNRDIKGEFVLVIDKNVESKNFDISIEEQYEEYIKQGLDDKIAIKKIAKERKQNKNDIYKKIKIEGGKNGENS